MSPGASAGTITEFVSQIGSGQSPMMVKRSAFYHFDSLSIVANTLVAPSRATLIHTHLGKDTFKPPLASRQCSQVLAGHINRESGHVPRLRGPPVILGLAITLEATFEEIDGHSRASEIE
jgi:hypothetical protein